MQYENIVHGKFKSRPNRFIAYVEIHGKEERVHVKNTGRCRELLVEDASVYLEKSKNPNRSTEYDLVVVEKKDKLVNMDSQAPNKVVEEWLYTKELFPDLVLVRPETKYKNSRFDFYIETEHEKIFMEVKGVTLEENGVMSFPDAPSDRAIKHLCELMDAKKEGYQVYTLFVIQMKGASYFMPNYRKHKEFALALNQAAKEGVHVLAYDCLVTEDSLKIDKPVEVRLGGIRDIAEPILEWYHQNRRILPWREEITPYRVWVSEIMLQQTRVEAVKPFFRQFMEKLPNIESLANAKEEVLLKLWEGLGYYNRVRNMQKAAQQIMEEYGGEMPASYEELQKLPGIGSYTAGAIASIAFQIPAPAVDGNVLRVLSRLTLEEGDVLSQSVKKKMEGMVSEIIPPKEAGNFTQAMIELGALVCAPNGEAHCDQCPISSYCQAYQLECVYDYPKKTEKKPRTVEEKTILILKDEEKYALVKRKQKGLLAGMYEFPSIDKYKTSDEVIDYLKGVGLQPLYIEEITSAKHIFSHKEWHMKGFAIRVDELSEKEERPETAQWIFADRNEVLEKYPIPSAFSAYVKYLNIQQGRDRIETGYNEKRI